MFIRESLGTTLEDLGSLLTERDSDVEEVRAHPTDIKFHLNAIDPVIKVGKDEYPAAEGSLAVFSDMLQIPAAFFKRAHQKVQSEHLDLFLNDMLANTLLKDAKVTIRGEHIDGVEEWGKEHVQPRGLVTAVANVLPANSEIVRLIDTPSAFSFDVRVPEDHKVGVFGDGEALNGAGSKVGDVTAGGVRVGINLKQGLAPTVEEYMYRLVCTNGMTMQDTGLKMDARNSTVDEVLKEVEGMAEIAFSRVERSIQHFYDLRQQRVNNPERALRTIGRERGIPERSMGALMDLAAGEDMPDDPSMFDVVNLVTNFANSPAVTRDGGRLILEGAGGSVISDHAARCGHCQQKVN